MKKQCIVKRNPDGVIVQVNLPINNQNQNNENNITDTILRTTAQGKASEGGILTNAITDIRVDSKATEQEIWEYTLENYAKTENLWIPDVEGFIGEYMTQGAEQIVGYRDGFVYKARFHYNNMSLEKFTESIVLHNTLFPQSSIETQGFGRLSKNTKGALATGYGLAGDFVTISKQRYFDKVKITEEELIEYMENLGFENTDMFTFEKDGLVLEDIHNDNVIKTKEGDFHVIDGVIKSEDSDLNISTEPVSFQKQDDVVNDESLIPEIVNTLLFRLSNTGLSNSIETFNTSQFESLMNRLELSENKESSTVKGFVHKDRVYLNDDVMTYDTPIHEFTHLYIKYLKQNKSDLYYEGLDLVKKEIRKENSEIKDVIDYVKSTQPDLTDDTLSEEILAELTGRRGLEILKSNEQSSITKWISDFWESVKNLLGLTEMTPEQVTELNIKDFADAMVSDVLKGRFDNLIREGSRLGYDYDTEFLARERFNIPDLKRISAGSDRIVYELNDGNILKVTKTARGLRQNMHEGSWDLVEEGIIPKAIERGLNYVVVERVEPIKLSQKFEVFDYESGNVTGKATVKEMLEALERYDQSEFDRHMPALQNTLARYGLEYIVNRDVLWGDMYRKANWGWKDGRPIHLDAGTFEGESLIRPDESTREIYDEEFREIAKRSKQIKKEYKDSDKQTKFQTTVSKDTIPSKLYNELIGIPFLGSENALKIYKDIYSDKMGYWQTNDNLNCK